MERITPGDVGYTELELGSETLHQLVFFRRQMSDHVRPWGVGEPIAGSIYQVALVILERSVPIGFEFPPDFTDLKSAATRDDLDLRYPGFGIVLYEPPLGAGDVSNDAVRYPGGSTKPVGIILNVFFPVRVRPDITPLTVIGPALEIAGSVLGGQGLPVAGYHRARDVANLHVVDPDVAAAAADSKSQCLEHMRTGPA